MPRSKIQDPRSRKDPTAKHQLQFPTQALLCSRRCEPAAPRCNKFATVAEPSIAFSVRSPASRRSAHDAQRPSPSPNRLKAKLQIQTRLPKCDPPQSPRTHVWILDPGSFLDLGSWILDLDPQPLLFTPEPSNSPHG